MPENSQKWKFTVNRGGTFIDIVAINPFGNCHTSKILTLSSEYSYASIEGIKSILDSGSDQSLDTVI